MSRSVVLRTLLGACLGCAGLVTSARATTPTSDPPAAVLPTITATVGVRGFSDPDSTPVVAIEVTSPRVVIGTVVVRTGEVSTARPIQVAAGVSKTVRLVSPSPPLLTGELVVELFDGSKLVTSTRLTPRAQNDVEVVGITEGLAARARDVPAQLPIAGNLGRAVFGLLPAELFDLGPGGVSQYDTIVAAAADLNALTDGQRSVLLGWVAGGGILVLDDGPDSAGLPAEWQPTSSGHRLAGFGLVLSRPGAATAGRWNDVVVASPPRAHDVGTPRWGWESDLDADLLRMSGLRIPPVGRVVVPLIAYSALASLGVYVLVRRLRRMTLSWVLVPALALVASGTLAATGGSFRAGARPAMATFVNCSAAGCDGLGRLLSYAERDGTVRTELPTGWQVENGLFRSGAGTTRLDRQDDGSGVLSQVIGLGQVAAVELRGVAPASTGIGLTARTAADGVSGTVRNDSGVDLTDVVAMSAVGLVVVGDLPAGASADYTIPDQGVRLIIPGGADIGPLVTTDAAGTERSSSIWNFVSERIALVSPGVVRVTGLADEWSGVVAPTARHRALLSAVAQVRATDGRDDADAVRISVVRSPFTLGSSGLEDLVLRYVMPADANRGGVSVDASKSAVEHLDVLVGDRWQQVPNTRGLTALPPGSARDGIVMLRVRRTDADGIQVPPSVSTTAGAR